MVGKSITDIQMQVRDSVMCKDIQCFASADSLDGERVKVALGNIGTSQTKTLLRNLASILKGMPRSLTDDSCGMNAVGEPYEGKPHVRFDEGLVETQFGWAPLVYSTANELD